MAFFKSRAKLYRRHKAMPIVQVVKNPQGQFIVPVAVHGNNNKIVIAPVIKSGADMSEEPTAQMARVVRNNPGLRISCRRNKSQNAEIFSMSEQDSAILDVAVLKDKESEKITVNIFKFNKHSGKGLLEIINSATMEPGTIYNFKASRSDVRYDDIVDAMHDSVDTSEVMVIKDFIYHPSGEKTVKSLNIMWIK